MSFIVTQVIVDYDNNLSSSTEGCSSYADTFESTISPSGAEPRGAVLMAGLCA